MPKLVAAGVTNWLVSGSLTVLVGGVAISIVPSLGLRPVEAFHVGAVRPGMEALEDVRQFTTPARRVLAPYVTGYAGWLTDLGYRPRTVDVRLWQLGQLGRWMLAEELFPAQIDRRLIEGFLAGQRSRGYRCVPAFPSFRPLLEYLTSIEVIGREATQPDELGVLLNRYRDWLANDRGLAAGTIVGRVIVARRFLNGTGASQDALQRLTGAEVLAECARLKRSTACNKANDLKSLLRFLFVCGLIRTALAEAVPPVASWRDTGIVSWVPAEDVQGLLDSCDRSTRTGLRDLAVLTLLVRLGLRSAEVANLELEDIDWRRGELVIHGKGRRIDRLPLLADVGQALADYLTRARPAGGQRRVFFTAVAPYRPLAPGRVSEVVARACRRAGLPEIGAHRLRHALAVRLLANGSPLADISQVLRHQDVATTAIYAKVDDGALRLLAKPWPTQPGVL